MWLILLTVSCINAVRPPDECSKLDDEIQFPEDGKATECFFKPPQDEFKSVMSKGDHKDTLKIDMVKAEKVCKEYDANAMLPQLTYRQILQFLSRKADNDNDNPVPLGVKRWVMFSGKNHSYTRFFQVTRKVSQDEFKIEIFWQIDQDKNKWTDSDRVYESSIEWLYPEEGQPNGVVLLNVDGLFIRSYNSTNVTKPFTWYCHRFLKEAPVTDPQSIAPETIDPETIDPETIDTETVETEIISTEMTIETTHVGRRTKRERYSPPNQANDIKTTFGRCILITALMTIVMAEIID